MVFKAALVQLCSGRDPRINVEQACALIGAAAHAGAHYVQTPEVTNILEPSADLLAECIDDTATRRDLARFSACARASSIWLHIGSMVVRAGERRFANRGFLIAPDGRIAAQYDKIHLFDVTLANGEIYRESRNYDAGHKGVVARLEIGPKDAAVGLGMTICYDLRFAYLYRALAQAGAGVLAVPAAFTKPTGEAHWHVLLRARAIETGCFVLAAAQGGTHESGRKTYGHTLAVSPWGDIIAEIDSDDPGYVVLDVDLDQVRIARERIPALQHDRDVTIARIDANALERAAP